GEVAGGVGSGFTGESDRLQRLTRRYRGTLVLAFEGDALVIGPDVVAVDRDDDLLRTQRAFGAGERRHERCPNGMTVGDVAPAHGVPRNGRVPDTGDLEPAGLAMPDDEAHGRRGQLDPGNTRANCALRACRARRARPLRAHHRGGPAPPP